MSITGIRQLPDLLRPVQKQAGKEKIAVKKMGSALLYRPGEIQRFVWGVEALRSVNSNLVAWSILKLLR